jgi:glycosyltransferase involved in cell wall biosynthesis
MSVIAIIPALNEAATIKSIIKVVKKNKLIDRILVVSDGSTDDTATIARKCGVDVIELKENVGKGGAMSIGVKQSHEDIILFLDADLIGLTSKHITDLLKPVLNNEASMSVGIFSNGRVATDLAQKMTPFLSGQRAIKRILFEQIDDIEASKYGVEVTLTKYVKKHKISYVKVKLVNLTHITKEEKLGLTKGFLSRLKMYKDIIKSAKIFDKM